MAMSFSAYDSKGIEVKPDEQRLSEIRESLNCEYSDLNGLKAKFGAALMDLGVLLSLLDSQQPE